MTDRVPFSERGGALRGVLDLVCGRFPAFVLGGGVASDLLPVFHFHEVTREELEPKLAYLAENGYRTVRADEIERFVRGSQHFDSRHVALCFDDAWASLWTVAAPLLKQYGLSAIAYAIPQRIDEASAPRPTIAAAADATAGSPFVTWPELTALNASGLVDVQCHTHTHSRVFCSPTVSGFVTPEYRSTPLLNRPQISQWPALRFVTTDDLGAPLYTARSRMSDGRRVEVSIALHEQCTALVGREGGAAFFTRPDWESRLHELTKQTPPAPPESEQAQERAILEELDIARSLLNARLKTTSVNHICLPWGVSGDRTAAALKRIGYRTAFANRLRGVHAVGRGDDPLWLKRLPNKYIFRLPGRGRRLWA